MQANLAPPPYLSPSNLLHGAPPFPLHSHLGVDHPPPFCRSDLMWTWLGLAAWPTCRWTSPHGHLLRVLNAALFVVSHAQGGKTVRSMAMRSLGHPHRLALLVMLLSAASPASTDTWVFRPPLFPNHGIKLPSTSVFFGGEMPAMLGRHLRANLSATTHRPPT